MSNFKVFFSFHPTPHIYLDALSLYYHLAFLLLFFPLTTLCRLLQYFAHFTGFTLVTLSMKTVPLLHSCKVYKGAFDNILLYYCPFAGGKL